jgi:hypothetical protein
LKIRSANAATSCCLPPSLSLSLCRRSLAARDLQNQPSPFTTANYSLRSKAKEFGRKKTYKRKNQPFRNKSLSSSGGIKFGDSLSFEVYSLTRKKTKEGKKRKANK